MLSPYRIQSNITNKRTKKVSNTNFDNNPHREHDSKKLQMTSLNLTQIQKLPLNVHLKGEIKNSLKGGSIKVNDEINGEQIDEILQNNNL